MISSNKSNVADLYKSIFDLSPDGIITIDLRGHVTSCNAAFSRITGYKENEIVGKHIFKIPTILSTNIPAYKILLGSALRGKLPGTFEFNYRRKDGSIHPAEGAPGFIKKGGRIVGVQAMVRDVTARKEMEDALQMSEEKYRGLIEKTDAGIAITDLKSRFTYVNSALCGMLGYRAEEMLGRPFADFLHLESRKKILTVFWNAFKRPGRIVELEFKATHKDGHTVHMHSRPNIYRRNGKISGFNAVIEDISERKRYEGMLIESEQKLRSLFDNMAEGLFIVDTKGKVLEANRKILDLTGLRKDEVIGRSLVQFLPKLRLSAKDVLGKFRSLLSGRSPGWIEFQVVNKKGIRRNIRGLGILLRQAGKVSSVAFLVQDVTDQKLTEGKLRGSEEKYRSVFNFVADGLVLIGEDGRILEVNESLLRFSGYSRKDLVGEKISSLKNMIHKESLPVMVKNFFKRKMGFPVKPYDIKARDKNGNEYWVEINARKMKIGRKRQFIIAALRNITDRKLAEEKIKQSEERFRQLFDNMSSGVAVYRAIDKGRDFVFVSFNKAGEKIDNIESEKVIGKSVKKVFPGVVDFGLYDVFRRVYRTGKPENLPISLYKDGRIEGWRENYVYKLPSGEIVAVYDDLTEQKKAEKELKERERKLEILFDILPVGVSILDAERNVVYVNPALERILSISMEGLYRGDYRGRRYLRPDGTSMPAEEFASVMAVKEQRAVNNVETGVLKEDGSIVWTDVSAVPVKFPDWNVVIVTSDITERKKHEKEIENLARFPLENPNPVLRVEHSGRIIFKNPSASITIEGCDHFKRGKVCPHLSDALSEAVKTMKTQHIECPYTGPVLHFVVVPIKDADYVNIYGFDVTEQRKAEQELIKAERFKYLGKLVGGIAHDVRNPLVAVKSFFQIVNSKEETEEDKKEISELAVNEIRRIEGLLDNLLNFANPRKVEFTTGDPAKILNEALDLVRYDASKSGIEMITDLDHGPCNVMMDPGQIEQVFLNVMMNALQSMGNGGRLYISSSFQKRDRSLRIIFKDTGQGIPDKDLAKLFEPFFTTKEKGTGLGLSISQRIIMDHKGKISVDSKEGKGTIVCITLPVS